MASSIFTDAGVNYIQRNIANEVAALGTLTAQVGTGTQAISGSLTDLATPYMISGARHSIILNGFNRVPATPPATIDGVRASFIDATFGAQYNASEIGIFNSDGTMIAYIVRDNPNEIIAVKPASGISDIAQIINASNVAAPNLAITSPIQGVGTATKTKTGSVQLGADDDTTSAGAVVLTPVQITTRLNALREALTKLISDAGRSVGNIQGIVGAMWSNNTETGISITPQTDGTIDAVVDYATAAEINTGTEKAKAVNPDELESSNYRHVHEGTTVPANTLGENGDLYVRRPS